MQQNRSLFGPLLLIAAGIVWLLVKSGTVPSANLWALTHIWPFLLIAAGLGIILKSYWRYTSMVLDVLIIGGAILAILYATDTADLSIHRGIAIVTDRSGAGDLRVQAVVNPDGGAPCAADAGTGIL